MGELATMLIQIGIEQVPNIIAAIHAAGGTVQNVGPILAQDGVTIDADIQQLKDEQKP
jgi:hypothetical protein